MFTFMHPYQKIRRLEQEVADLRAQLKDAPPTSSCRLLSLMKPTHSIGILQSRGADMLASMNSSLQEYADQLAGERATLTETSTLINAAEQAVSRLYQRCHVSADANTTPPPLSADTLKAMGQFQATLAQHANHAHALAINTAQEAACQQGLQESADHAHHEDPARIESIADDAHLLALNMHQMSHQMNVLMEQVNSQVREHSQAMKQKHQADEEMAQAAHAAKRALEQLTDQTQHMHKVIHHSATAAFLHSAKLDHAVWKYRLYKHLLSANMDIRLENHQQCRLGRWHQLGEDYHRYAHSDAYRALIAPHRRMHESGAEALNFARLGDHPGLLASLGIMEEASHQLALQLDKLMEHALYDAPFTASQFPPLTGRS